MNGNFNSVLSLDREEMTDTERELFLKDLNRVIGEYFETEGATSLEVTRTESGFLVCVLLSARRIKNLKKPL